MVTRSSRTTYRTHPNAAATPTTPSNPRKTQGLAERVHRLSGGTRRCQILEKNPASPPSQWPMAESWREASDPKGVRRTHLQNPGTVRRGDSSSVNLCDQTTRGRHTPWSTATIITSMVNKPIA